MEIPMTEAKLTRDRSTPERDAWWTAVLAAAATAPKLHGSIFIVRVAPHERHWSACGPK